SFEGIRSAAKAIQNTPKDEEEDDDDGDADEDSIKDVSTHDEDNTASISTEQLFDCEDLNKTKNEDENEPDELNPPFTKVEPNTQGGVLGEPWFPKSDQKTKDGYLKDGFVESENKISDDEFADSDEDVIVDSEIMQLLSQHLETRKECLNVLTSNIFVSLNELKKQKYTIYDPCCGRHKNILNYFQELNFSVDGSDLYYGNEKKDLFKMEQLNEKYIVITNTPYKNLNKYIKKISELCDNFIVLVPTYAVTYKEIRKLFHSKKCMIISCGANMKFDDASGELKDIRHGVCWLCVGDKFYPNKSVEKLIVPFIPYHSDVHRDGDAAEKEAEKEEEDKCEKDIGDDTTVELPKKQIKKKKGKKTTFEYVDDN
ncbi:MAG: hypothetical protein K2X39_02935, partial [Silvanigrellaceae bacterium]|nr:hypothetical protein [Silvanigrellaceae bacterium]